MRTHLKQAPEHATPATGPSPESASGAGMRGNSFFADQLRTRPGVATDTAETDTFAGDLFGSACAHGHDHGVEVARPDRSGDVQSAGAAQRRPGVALEPAQRQAVLARLQTIPRAAEALAEIQKVAGNLDFPIKWSGRGTYMSRGEIWLDLRADETDLLVTMSHELIHLLSHLRGFKPSPRKMERDDYVNAMMSDELDSEEASIVAGLQLTKGAGEPRSKPFRAWLVANHPGKLESALRSNDPAEWKAIQELARTWSDERFRTTYQTSNTGQNYYDYWGSHWDKSNGGRASSRENRGQPAPEPVAPARSDMEREGTLTDPHDTSKAVPLDRALAEARASGGPLGVFLMNRYGFGPQVPGGGRGKTVRFFSNGLNTAEPEASKRTRYIADALQQPMMHLHNGTMAHDPNILDHAPFGLGNLVRGQADNVDALIVRAGVKNTEYMKQLEKLLTAALSGADPQDVHAILHSDATIGGARVVAEFKEKEIQRRLAKLPSHQREAARPAATREVEALLKKHLFIEMHGNATRKLVKGPRYLVWTDIDDPVTHKALPQAHKHLPLVGPWLPEHNMDPLGVSGRNPGAPDPNVVYVDYDGPYPDWDSHNLTATGVHVVKATLELNGVRTTEELHALAMSGQTIKVPRNVKGDVNQLWNRSGNEKGKQR